MYRILIVEDDLVIARSLQKQLGPWGLEIEYITEFDRVLESFIEIQPQLVLLDISLPFYNGFYWCKEFRKLSKVPIIFLSSADDNMNIVMAMNMGADDFIAKPFDLNVLAAKINALLRRAYAFGGQAELVEFKGAVVNLSDASIRLGDRKAQLTKNEFKILQCLLESRGKIVSRDAIIKQLWEDESFIDDNTLTVNVTRLRKKLEEIGLTGAIGTKKGFGYLLEED